MNTRILRINSEIEKAVSEIINYELKNPLINGIISVIKVQTSPDLEQCKIYISIYNASNKEDVFNQIKHSAGFIRKTLCKKVDLRKMPFLEFFLDDSIEYKEKMDKKFNEIRINEINERSK